VEIRYEPGALGLVVADNGIGAEASFDTGLQEGSGHGLTGMVERASALGGWLKAGPRPAS
jgi:signal transduction histidine kinase